MLRWAVIIVLVLLVISGLRNWLGLSGSAATTPAPSAGLPASALFPAESAAGFALRFAPVYGSWNEDEKKGARDKMLAALWTGEAGWNGRGRQQFSGLTVASVEVMTPTVAVITVSGSLTAFDRDRKGAWQAKPARPAALAIPIIATPDGAIAVHGTPMWVAPPAPVGGAEQSSLTDSDSELTAATQPVIEEFFRAYGADDALGSLTAPGSTLRGLGGAMTLDTIVRWEARPDTEDRTRGRATITWATPGTDAQTTQTYELVLTRTSGAGATRWQVFDLDPLF